jgi:hypothetical protein
MFTNPSTIEHYVPQTTRPTTTYSVCSLFIIFNWKRTEHKLPRVRDKENPIVISIPTLSIEP